jgi:hypothetical protein
MSEQHKASAEEWATIEKLGRNNFYAPSCILELRARVEALEGKYETQRLATLELGEDVDKVKRWSSRHLERIMALEQIRAAAGLPERSSLVERVAMAADCYPYENASAAIREVAATARFRDLNGQNVTVMTWEMVAQWLEQEAER